MTKKECTKCLKEIDLNKDLYVTLGTHQGKEITDMAYFHFNCWKLHFEERARLKAEAVVGGMQKRMMPIAKQMVEKLTGAIGSGSDEVYEIKN